MNIHLFKCLPLLRFSDTKSQDRSFDTTLKYAEDAKLIMDILLDCPRYGIVPSGRYSIVLETLWIPALNVSKHRKEVY